MPRDARLDDFEESAAESNVDSSAANADVDASAAESTDGTSADNANGDEGTAAEGAAHAVEGRTRGEASPDRVDESTVVPTTEWTPGGAACADCGAVVERRWRQDGAYVCPDCKTWNDS